MKAVIGGTPSPFPTGILIAALRESTFPFRAAEPLNQRDFHAGPLPIPSLEMGRRAD
jgi:hypothetical protein